MKKTSKHVMGLVKATVITSGGSLALGAMGGSVGLRGQQALGNVSGVFPAMGSVIGAGMVIQTAKRLIPKPKRKLRF